MIRRSRTLDHPHAGEEGREESLSQQAQALDLLPVLVRDERDRIIYWSQGAQLLYGFIPEEALGHLSHQLLQTQVPEPLERIRAHMQKGRPWHGELAQVRKNGSRIFVASQWVPSHDPHTGQRTTVEVNTDITQHRLAEADHDQLAAIVESSEDAIIGKSLDGMITSWNAAAERMFGYRAHEAIGQFITLIIPPELQVEESIILGRLRAGEHLESFETVRLTKDGRRLDVSLTISPVRDASGTLVGASKIVRDISRRKSVEAAARLAREMAHRRQVEQREQILLQAHAETLEKTVAERTGRLRETVAELEAFSYSVSHDIPAPIRAIHGFAELGLRTQNPLSRPTGELLRKILEASETVDHLIQGLLTLVRASHQHITLAPVSLDKLAREVIQERPELQAAKAEITLQSPLLPVLGHEASLRQCLINLLGNAIKYVAPGTRPRIRLWTELRPPAEASELSTLNSQLSTPIVRLWVEDNGIGISPEAREKVFELLHRAHNHSKYEGSGLGLAIVKKAVERMCGRVGVESAPDQGSRFWIDLAAAPKNNHGVEKAGEERPLP